MRNTKRTKGAKQWYRSRKKLQIGVKRKENIENQKR